MIHKHLHFRNSPTVLEMFDEEMQYSHSRPPSTPFPNGIPSPPVGTLGNLRIMELQVDEQG